jgi:hypothetical protein
MFERKVELLESWARNGGPPSGATVPDGVKALQRWEDEPLGLEPWASPNVATPNGRHGDLRRRFDAALAALFQGGNGQNRPRSRHATEVTIRQLKSDIVRLAEQVISGEEKIRRLENDLAIEKQTRGLAEERAATLAAELSKITPLYRK